MPSSLAVSWSTLSLHVRNPFLTPKRPRSSSSIKELIYDHVTFVPVRFVPDWFPGAGFKRLARVAKARGEHMVDGAFNAAKKAMNSEDSIPSLVGTLLSREEPKEMTREEYEYTIKWAAGSLYGGAYRQTSSSSYSL
jgi:hypothetical protein